MMGRNEPGVAATRRQSARKQHREDAGSARRREALAAAILCALALTSCSRAAPPAPVVFKGSEAAPPAPRTALAVRPPARPPARPSPTSDREANPRASVPLPAPAVAAAPRESVVARPLETVTPGPARPPANEAAARGRTVVAAADDTVYSVARRNEVTPREVVEANRLQAPFRLDAGQSLVIPDTRTHTVGEGETVYSISRAYGVDMYSLVRANGIAAPHRILVGQRLALPGATAEPQVQPAVATAPAGAPPAVQAQPVSAIVPPPPPRSGSRFLWPVRGNVVSGFGPKPDGLHNDGINIAVKAGAPVRAADDGVVAYTGNELRGFGNLLLVRHDGGWITAYAHNENVLVRRGDRVKRGQVVAHAGASGRVGEPQLHFEIRKGTKAVDPLRYLEPL